MFKYLLPFFLSLAAIFEISAQNKVLANPQSVRDELGAAAGSGQKNSYINSNNYEGIVGSPFLIEDWSNGEVCLSFDKAVMKTNKVKYKFDAYKNEIWYLTEKQDSFIVNSPDIVWFKLKGIDSTYNFVKMPTIDPKNPHKFYSYIYQSKLGSIFKLESKRFIKANFTDKGIFKSGTKYDYFEDNDEFYFSSDNVNFQKAKPTRKGLVEILPKSASRKAKSKLKKVDDDDKLNDAEIVLFLKSLED